MMQQSTFNLDTLRGLEEHGADQASLGSIVSWGVKQVLIQEPDLRSLLDGNGLLDVPIPAITERKALNRALKEMVEDEIIRLVADTKTRLTYVLLKLRTDPSLEEVQVNRTLKVTYHKDSAPGTDPLVFSSPTAESVLRPLIHTYQTSYVSGDISRFILLSTIKAHGGIALRPEGGMYFVPVTEKQVVLKLRAFMEALGKQNDALCYLSVFNVIDDAAAKADMQRHAHDALMAEVRGLAQRLGKLTSNPNRGVRAATVAKYLGEADRVGKEVSLYRDMILLKAEDITTALDTLRQQFRAVLQGDGAVEGEDPFATAKGRRAHTTQTVQERTIQHEAPF